MWGWASANGNSWVDLILGELMWLLWFAESYFVLDPSTDFIVSLTKELHCGGIAK